MFYYEDHPHLITTYYLPGKIIKISHLVRYKLTSMEQLYTNKMIRTIHV